MNTTLIVVLAIFFFILILVALIVAFVWSSNRNPNSPGIGQQCTGTCAGDLICSSNICLLPLNGACSISSQCADGSLCLDGLCKYSNNHVCSTNSDCASGLCSSGICSPGLHFNELAAEPYQSVNDDEAIVDAVMITDKNYGVVTLMLFGSGKILVQNSRGTKTVESGVRLNRLFWCWDHLYGLSDGKIFKLQSNLRESDWGWSLIQTAQRINHISADLKGESCWIQSGSYGRIVQGPSEFSGPLNLFERGERVLGTGPSNYIVIRPDRTVEYRGERWTEVKSAVLLPDDTVAVETKSHIRLAVLGGEVVSLE